MANLRVFLCSSRIFVTLFRPSRVSSDSVKISSIDKSPPLLHTCNRSFSHQRHETPLRKMNVPNLWDLSLRNNCSVGSHIPPPPPPYRAIRTRNPQVCQSTRPRWSSPARGGSFRTLFSWNCGIFHLDGVFSKRPLLKIYDGHFWKYITATSDISQRPLLKIHEATFDISQRPLLNIHEATFD